MVRRRYTVGVGGGGGGGGVSNDLVVGGGVEYESERADVPNQLRVNPKLKVRECIDMTTPTAKLLMMRLMTLMMGVMRVLTWKRKTNWEWTRNCEGGTAKAAGR